MIRLATIALVLVLIAASATMAVPRLQIYIPGGTYDASTQTWVTSTSGPFEVWVIAAKLDQGQIHDVNLIAALVPDADPFGGSLSITDLGTAVTSNYTGADFMWDTPPPGAEDLMPPHSIYPTWYVQHQAAAVTSAPYVTVDDYSPDESGSDNFGNIFRFEVSTTYSMIHFDATGYYQDPDGRWIRAPLSHDGEFTMVPEPATIFLFGLGLAGTGLFRRFSKLTK